MDTTERDRRHPHPSPLPHAGEGAKPVKEGAVAADGADSLFPGPGERVGVRGPELAVALVLMAAGVLVIVDSIRVGIGWADDGPRSGYFPFYIGLFLLAASTWTAVQQLRNWRKTETFAEKSQLADVWAIAWPMTIYVGLIALAGIYIASAVLIAYFMLRHGKHSAWVTAAVALGVPIVSYLVFARWFLVKLPTGPLEQMLGL
jgi:putative tricarboxylic transport membrane protein